MKEGERGIILFVKDNRIKIQINRPVSEVYAFTLDPKNTPSWIDDSAHEETSE